MCSPMRRNDTKLKIAISAHFWNLISASQFARYSSTMIGMEGVPQTSCSAMTFSKVFWNSWVNSLPQLSAVWIWFIGHLKIHVFSCFLGVCGEATWRFEIVCHELHSAQWVCLTGFKSLGSSNAPRSQPMGWNWADIQNLRKGEVKWRKKVPQMER